MYISLPGQVRSTLDPKAADRQAVTLVPQRYGDICSRQADRPCSAAERGMAPEITHPTGAPVFPGGQRARVRPPQPLLLVEH